MGDTTRNSYATNYNTYTGTDINSIRNNTHSTTAKSDMVNNKVNPVNQTFGDVRNSTNTITRKVSDSYASSMGNGTFNSKSVDRNVSHASGYCMGYDNGVNRGVSNAIHERYNSTSDNLSYYGPRNSNGRGIDEFFFHSVIATDGSTTKHSGMSYPVGSVDNDNRYCNENNTSNRNSSMRSSGGKDSYGSDVRNTRGEPNNTFSAEIHIRKEKILEALNNKGVFAGKNMSKEEFTFKGKNDSQIELSLNKGKKGLLESMFVSFYEKGVCRYN